MGMALQNELRPSGGLGTGDQPDEDALEQMQRNAGAAAGFLKALAHEGRLMILCHLVDGEKSVTELERLLGARQAAVSQQLARLRLEGLVNARREGKAIFYSLSDERSSRLIGTLHDIFCATDKPG
jgi:DNA-binding transcriptional ArsR family regulator